MTKDEALDLALEALEVGQTAVTMFNLVPKPHLTKAITAIKQARSAPITKDELTEPLGCVVVRPLLANSTSPPTAQEDIQRLSALVRAQQITIDKLEQARSAPVQEPVATIDSLEQEIYENTREFVSLNVMEWLLKRLNTTPPAAQRQWVGLTDEEIERMGLSNYTKVVRETEAKLRSKNNG
jgi:hypothetical protein